MRPIPIRASATPARMCPVSRIISSCHSDFSRDHTEIFPPTSSPVSKQFGGVFLRNSGKIPCTFARTGLIFRVHPNWTTANREYHANITQIAQNRPPKAISKTSPYPPSSKRESPLKSPPKRSEPFYIPPHEAQPSIFADAIYMKIISFYNCIPPFFDLAERANATGPTSFVDLSY